MEKNNELELNLKQKTFCQEYIIDFNGTRAAISAGYSKNSAKEIASENLTKPNIQRYINELINKRNERLEFTQDDVLRDLIEVKNRCMQKVPVMYYDKENKEYKQETNENGDGVWKFDAQGANSALDKLAKHVGFYEADNQQQQSKTEINNIVDEKKIKSVIQKLNNISNE